ncbi:NAD(P)-binding protein [Dentipellis sp. KUC8613]|nr:NAD(P)-binding protein [Dentipellis sp. KUC8613]
MASKIVIVGGHGKVALRLAGLLAPTRFVTSIIRNEAQIPDIKAVSSHISPHILSLEDAPAADFTRIFTGADVVVFSAGAGGKGGPERTLAIDYHGAVKVFDAIEAVEGTKPRLLLVSAIDIRDHSKPFPAHYNESDKEVSRKYGDVLKTYLEAKYLADKNLVERTAFKWTILRPGGLLDTPGTGRVSIGRTHLSPAIAQRDDVAQILAHLVDRPDAAGLAIDAVGGDSPIAEALDAFIKKGETDWLG